MREIKKLQAQILQGREMRAERRRELVRLFKKPLISFSLNAPGPNKNSSPWPEVYEAGLAALERELSQNRLVLVWREESVTAAGHQAFLIIEGDPGRIKRACVEIESRHPLGRLFDFDVFDERHSLLTRNLFGLRERTCLLCGGQVNICRRSRKHTLTELTAHIDQMVANYFRQTGDWRQYETEGGYPVRQ